jgi:hypothetical protein
MRSQSGCRQTSKSLKIRDSIHELFVRLWQVLALMTMQASSGFGMSLFSPRADRSADTEYDT